MPSVSIDSCAGVSDTAPSVAPAKRNGRAPSAWRRAPGLGRPNTDVSADVRGGLGRWRSFRRWRAASAPIGRSSPQHWPPAARAVPCCVLPIAKRDRLARKARFLLSVVEGSGEAGVVFCDLPTVPAGPVGKFLVTQMAAVRRAGSRADEPAHARGFGCGEGARCPAWQSLPYSDDGRNGGSSRRNAARRFRNLVPSSSATGEAEPPGGITPAAAMLLIEREPSRGSWHAKSCPSLDRTGPRSAR